MVSYFHVSSPFPFSSSQMWYHVFTETPSKVTNPKAEGIEGRGA